MVAARLIMHGTRGEWHPLHLSRSVLKAWWAADDLPDGTVASWADRITGLAVTQGTSGQRPLKASTSFNNAYPGVTFDGVDDNLTTTTLTAIPTGSTPGEVWAVGQAAIVPVALGFAISYGAAAGQRRRLQINTAGSPPGQVGCSDGTVTIATTVLFTAPAFVSMNVSGTVMNMWANGNPSVSNPAAIATVNTGTARLRIGAGDGAAAANFWQGPVRHVILLQGVLSTALRQKMEGWLAWDSGLQTSLPATHPYQLFRP